LVGGGRTGRGVKKRKTSWKTGKREVPFSRARSRGARALNLQAGRAEKKQWREKTWRKRGTKEPGGRIPNTPHYESLPAESKNKAISSAGACKGIQKVREKNRLLCKR